MNKSWLLVMLSLALFGCSAEAIRNAMMSNPDNRTFIYDVGLNGSGAISRTIADKYPDDAFTVYGRLNLSISDCLNLPDDYGRERCLESAAIYLKDPTICKEDSQQYSSACYLDYAVKAGDASSCDSEGQSMNCSSAADPASCMMYQGWMVADCKRQVAVTTASPSLCTFDPTETDGQLKYGLCINASAAITPSGECSNPIVPTELVDSTDLALGIQWMRQNHPGAKVLSWWDYGSSLDCSGLQSVISNQNVNDPAIPQVADLLVAGNESELIPYMNSVGARYLMLDSELLSGGGQLGGKFGALNYLSCVYTNQTSADQPPGASQCESNNLWETAFVSEQPCNISQSNDSQGLIAYELYQSGNRLVDYPSECVYPNDSAAADYCNSIETVPTYCMGNVTLADGQSTFGSYYINQTDQNGDLKLNKAILELPYQISSTPQMGPVTQVTLFYTEDALWTDNGQRVSGYSDRKGIFYDSVLYRGLLLNDLTGFNLVYTDPTNSLKIFELNSSS